MARKFLTSIDLNLSELQNAVIQNLASDPSTGNTDGRIYYNTASDSLKLYANGTWIDLGVGDITDIQGTTNEVTVSIVDGVATISLPSTINADTSGNAATATKWATARTVSFAGGDVTGSFSIDGSANVSNVDLTIGANSVALGTDTTGDYVATIGGTDGVSITGSGTEGRAVTVANTDKGSSQNIFKTVTDGSNNIEADSNSDTLTVSAGTGITVSANGATDTLTIGNSGVTSLVGTTNQITASASTGSVTLSLPSAVTFPGTVTLNADPTTDLHAATKAYVDTKVNGLTWKSAANLLANANVALTGTSGTLVIDGHAALDSADTGYRILLTNQSTNSENGIYLYSDNSSTYTLSRSTDADVYTELIGASIFIQEGTTYGSTSWVQSNHYLTDFTGQTWDQVGAQSVYTAGNGLSLVGNAFSINTAVTVDVSTAQTLTNKTITSPIVSGLYLSDNQIVIEGDPDTSETTLVFTNPTADRTITFKDATGTVALTSDITAAVDAITTTVIEEGTNLYFTDERAQDAVGGIVSGSNSLAAVYNDGSNTLTFDTTLAATSYMSKTSGLAVDVSTLETKLVTDGFPKKVSASVGNASATSFAVTHSFGTRDVTVNVYDNASFDTVECDVVRTDTNTVTVSFASAPTTNAYRVVIVG